MYRSESRRVRLISHRRGERIPSAAAWLSGLGVIPFAVGAAAGWFGPEPLRALAMQVVSVYAATILSFLGGIAWGVACASSIDEPWSGDAGRILAASVVPSLIGWGAVFLPQPFSLIAFAISFAGVLVLDLWLEGQGLVPPWWMKLRVRITAAVVALLVAAAAAHAW